MNKACLILSLVLSVMIFDGCVEPTEGCLDPFSSNYELMASDECEDCCTYPSFSIGVQYLYGEETIDTSIYYQVSNDNYFRLRSFYLVLSEFAFTGDNGNYELIGKTEGKDIKDDLVGIRYRNGSGIPGTISIEDSIRMVDFKIGMPEALDNPQNADLDYSVLEFLKDSSYVDSIDNRFYKMIVEVEVDSSTHTEIKLGFDDLDERFSSNVMAGTSRGNSMSIQLLIDFERLFSGVEFQSTNVESEAKDILSQNIGTAIEVN